MSISFFVTMLEMIGSAAFAVSGVVVAKTKKMDMWLIGSYAYLLVL